MGTVVMSALRAFLEAAKRPSKVMSFRPMDFELVLYRFTHGPENVAQSTE